MADTNLELSSSKAIILDRIRRMADCLQRHGAVVKKTILAETGCLGYEADYVLRLMRDAQLIHSIGSGIHTLWKLNKPVDEGDLKAIYQPTLRAKEQPGELSADMQKLLETLRIGDLWTKKDLMDVLGVSANPISRRLAALKIAGLIGYECNRTGTKFWYAIRPEMVGAIALPHKENPPALDSEHMAWMMKWREARARRLAQQQRAIAHG